MEQKLDRISRQESKVLARLNREARRERRLRGGRAETAGSFEVVTEPLPHRRFGKRRPRLRQFVIWLVTAASAVFVMMMILPPFLLPVDGVVTSRFSLRTAPESSFLFDIEHHRGIDIGAAEGTPVLASRSGRVIQVSENQAYGLMVDVRHPLGLTTRYAHMSASRVREGQWVWRRGRIGSVGSSGRATGPHLHFEVRVGNRSLPPGIFLMFHQLRRSLIGSGR